MHIEMQQNTTKEIIKPNIFTSQATILFTPDLAAIMDNKPVPVPISRHKGLTPMFKNLLTSLNIALKYCLFYNT